MYKTTLILFAFCLVTACAGRVAEDYAGVDRGWLLLSLGATPPNTFRNYTLFIDSKDGAQNAPVSYICGGTCTFSLVATPRDFDNQDENGVVIARPLPAGDYIIKNFRASSNDGFTEKLVSSETDFAIPFTIRSGRATYIGSFKALPVTGENIFGITIDGGVFFLVTDKSDRDIPIARSKTPQITDIDKALVDADMDGTPLFRSSIAAIP